MNSPLRLPRFPTRTTGSPDQARSVQKRANWLLRSIASHLPARSSSQWDRLNGSPKNGETLPISRMILR